MRNYFPKKPLGAPLHTLSKLYDVPVVYGTRMSLVATKSKSCNCSKSYILTSSQPKGHVMSTNDGWATLWWITAQIWLLCNHPTLRCKREEITDKRIDKRTKKTDGRTIQLHTVNAPANHSSRRIKTNLFRANRVSQTIADLYLKYHDLKSMWFRVWIIENVCMNFQSDRA